jgi:CPA1 family monovalent cation:H+ antiporter
MPRESCAHVQDLRREEFPPPRTPNGCEACLKAGTIWVALRLCKECGHVGCCDSSPSKHATRHFEQTGHPVMRSLTPPTAIWTWCYVHEVTGELTDAAS